MKIKKQRSMYYGLSVVFLLLIMSISAYKLVPFAKPDGLDFNNLYTYATCDKVLSEKYEGNIYLASGADCGDVMKRDFIYPPLLYYTGKWVSYFTSFESARLAWRIFIILALFICLFVWIGNIKDFVMATPIIILLYLQYPMLFALERGNNDILVIIPWTLSFYCYKKRHYKSSGFFGALSVIMKVYPLFSFTIIGLAGLVRGVKSTLQRNRIDLRIKEYQYIYGAFLAGLLCFVIYNHLWVSFFRKLSGFASYKMVLSYLNHSVQYMFEAKVVNILIFLSVFGAWIVKRLYVKDDDLKITFAGALAVSTYFSAVSYDYNLITTYPLLAVLFLELVKNFTWGKCIAYIVLILGICGNRYWFIWGESDWGFVVRILLQLAGIMYFALMDLPIWKLKTDLEYMYLKRKYKIWA